MKYYISAPYADHGLRKKLAEMLSQMGHVVINKWVNDVDIRNQAVSVLSEASFNIVQSIRDSELFLLICPTTRTTATEFGIALSSRYGKRIVVYSPNENDFKSGIDTCVFYHHPSVTCVHGSFDDLITFLKTV